MSEPVTKPLTLVDVVSVLQRTVPHLTAESAFGEGSELLAYTPELADKIRAVLARDERQVLLGVLSCVSQPLRAACVPLVLAIGEENASRLHQKCMAMKALLPHFRSDAAMSSYLGRSIKGPDYDKRSQHLRAPCAAFFLDRLNKLVDCVYDPDEPFFPLADEPAEWLAPAVSDLPSRCWMQLRLQIESEEPSKDDEDNFLRRLSAMSATTPALQSLARQLWVLNSSVGEHLCVILGLGAIASS